MTSDAVHRPRLARRARLGPGLGRRLPRRSTRQGWQPARVVAAHRDAWVVATPDAGDRDAVVSGRLRHEVDGPGDLPAVGDWVAAAGLDGDGAPRVIQAVLPRRAAFTRNVGERRRPAPRRRAGPRGQRRRGVRRRGPGRRLQPPAPRALPRGGVGRRRDAGRRCSTRPTSPTTSTGSASPPRPSRPGVDVRTAVRAAPATASTSLAARPPRRRAGPRWSSARRASASPTLVNALVGSERQRTGAVREDDSRGRHTTTHRELVRLPGGALLIDTPGIRSLGVDRRRRRARRRVRGHRGARDELPLQRLPSRERARLRRQGGAGRRPARRRTGSRATASSSARRRTSPARTIPSSGPRSAASGGDPRVRQPAHAAQVRERPMTTSPARPARRTPSRAGITFRRWPGLDDLPGMAAANNALRAQCGILEPIDRRGHARTATPTS